jgi:putative Mg2+ transporter-C (MgtC) family protein
VIHVWLDSLLRLGVATIAGAAIGWEREHSGRPAGLRTHMLVSLGAALVMFVPLQIGIAESARVIQGVVTGIGFLCAGDILHHVREGHERVKGLTSAAALWVTATIGVVAAHGLWHVVVIGTGLTLVVLKVVKRYEPQHSRDETSDKPDQTPPQKPTSAT